MGVFLRKIILPAFVFGTMMIASLSLKASDRILRFLEIPGYTDTICLGDTAILTTPIYGFNYFWTPEFTIVNPNFATVKAVPLVTTTYYCSIQGISNNLVANGDFSQGNTGFTSNYTYNSNLWAEGTYYVGSNPNTYHPNFIACQDHTTGTGNMLIVNGASVPNANIWQKTINVVPYTTYIFSCWLTSVTSSNPAQLQFFVNNVQIGQVFNATPTNCSWNMFYNLWYSGSNTSANISIKNQNSQLSGNDFAIDDIYFAQVIDVIDTVNIVVENPHINLGADTLLCPGKNLILSPGNGFVSYQWSTGTTTPQINVINAGNYFVKVTTQAGCKANDTINVMYSPGPVVQYLSDSVCIGDTATLSASGAANYLWNTGATTPSIHVSPIITTNYSVIVSDTVGCTDTTQLVATIIQKPIITLNGNFTICENDSFHIIAGGTGSQYIWNSIPGGNTFSDKLTQSQSYSLNVTNNFGCKADTSFQITVIDYPIVQITSDHDTICRGASAILTASTANYTYLWNTGGNSNAIEVSPKDNTSYTLIVSNSQNGVSCSSNFSYFIFVKNCKTIYFPSAFTPDGINRIFLPVGDFVPGAKYYLAIFNRWGEMLFETNNPELGWDGHYQGELVESGVYVFYFSYQFGSDEVYTRTGTVTLVD